MLLTGAVSLVDCFAAAHLGDPVTARAYASVLIDFAIGATLVGGSDRFWAWAILRAGAGAIVMPALFLLDDNHLGAVLQLMACSALLGLLWGKASKARMIVSLCVLALALGVTLLCDAIVFALGPDTIVEPLP